MMKSQDGIKTKCYSFVCMVLLGALILPTLSYAATFYASINGNDGNVGSQAAPFRTIKYSLGRLVAGDTLLIRGGTYSEMLESHNGTNFPSGNSWANPVKVASFSGEKVTLLGKMAIGIETPPTQYLIFDGITIDATGLDVGVAMNGGSHHIKFINGEVKNSDGQGFMISYHSVEHLGSVPAYNEFINMNIHHNGTNRNQDHGMYIKTSGNLIENCKIHNNYAWGIHQYVHPTPTAPDANDNIIRNNEIWGNGVLNGSGGGIIIGSGKNNLAYNNLVYRNQNGIKVTGGNIPHDNLVYNNTVYLNVGVGVLVNTKSIGAKIINNLLYKNGIPNQELGQSTIFNNNLLTNPNFIDDANNNFQLLGTSSAINKGKPLEEVKTDILGAQRPLLSPTIGAYEYNTQLTNEAPKNLRIMTK